MFTKLFQNYKFLLVTELLDTSGGQEGKDDKNTQESAMDKVQKFLGDMADSIDEDDLVAAQGIRKNMEEADKELDKQMDDASEFVKSFSQEERKSLSEMVHAEFKESLAGGIDIKSEKSLDVFKELVATIDPDFDMDGFSVEKLRKDAAKESGAVVDEIVLEFKDGKLTLLAPIINTTTQTKDLLNKKIKSYGSGGVEQKVTGKKWRSRGDDSDFDGDDILDDVERVETLANTPTPEEQKRTNELTKKLNKGMNIDSKEDFENFTASVQAIDSKFVDISERYEDIRAKLLNEKGEKVFSVSYQDNEVRIFEPRNRSNDGVNEHTFTIDSQGGMKRDSSPDQDLTYNNTKPVEQSKASEQQIEDVKEVEGLDGVGEEPIEVTKEMTPAERERSVMEATKNIELSEGFRFSNTDGVLYLIGPDPDKHGARFTIGEKRNEKFSNLDSRYAELTGWVERKAKKWGHEIIIQAPNDVVVTGSNDTNNSQITNAPEQQEPNGDKLINAEMRIKEIEADLPKRYALSIETNIPGIAGDKPKVKITRSGDDSRTGYMTIENSENADRIANKNDFQKWVDGYINRWGDTSNNVSDPNKVSKATSNIEPKDTEVSTEKSAAYAFPSGFHTIKENSYQQNQQLLFKIDAYIRENTDKTSGNMLLILDQLKEKRGELIENIQNVGRGNNETQSNIQGDETIGNAINDSGEAEGLQDVEEVVNVAYEQAKSVLSELATEGGDKITYNEQEDTLIFDNGAAVSADSEKISIVIPGHPISYDYSYTRIIGATDSSQFNQIKGYIVSIIDTIEPISEEETLEEKYEKYIQDLDVQEIVSQVPGFTLERNGDKVMLHRYKDHIREGQFIRLKGFSSEKADWQGALETKESFIKWINDFYEKEGYVSATDTGEVTLHAVDIPQAQRVPETAELLEKYNVAKSIYETFVTDRKLGVMYRDFIESELNIDNTSSAKEIYNSVVLAQHGSNVDGHMGSNTLAHMLVHNLDKAVHFVSAEDKRDSADSVRTFINSLNPNASETKEKYLRALRVPNGLDNNTNIFTGVVKFQLMNNLEPDGLLGDRTKRVLALYS